MICIIENLGNPYWNLAAEEFIFNKFDEPVFRLWRNSSSVIIGQNQNALAEIDYDFVRSHDIPVVRRLSGGGAVFHDAGNVNYTFIQQSDTTDTTEMFRIFTKPVLASLQKLGVDARLEGRNDLTIEGRKFSGNAIYRSRGKVMMHGTLLFSASMENLSDALRYRPEKFADKAVKSNRSRVTNISEHLSESMSVEQFMTFMADSIASEFERYEYSESDCKAIGALMAEKYATDEWNYGHSPAYEFNRVQKFPCGLFELFLNVKGGRISALEIKGDYFFNLPTKEFCAAMKGCQHTEKAIAARIAELPYGEYFCGLEIRDLVQLFF